MAPLCKGSSREAGEGLTFSIDFGFFRNLNTPQSAVRLAAALFERGQPIVDRLLCYKRKKYSLFI